ncbi:MAG: hypothetical protein ACXU7Z_08100 [Burkholderiaceae bacterium]
MRPVVVPHGTWSTTRKKTLKQGLIEKRGQDLATASKTEREKILTEIDAEVEATINEEMKNWMPAELNSSPFLEQISAFKAALVIILLLAAMAGMIWFGRTLF